MPGNVLRYLERMQEVELSRHLVRSASITNKDMSIGPQPQHRCENALNVLVGTNEIAIDAAVLRAKSLGYHSVVLEYGLEGEARDVGYMFSILADYISASIENRRDRTTIIPLGDIEFDLIRQGIHKDTIKRVQDCCDKAAGRSQPICVIAGGETTVSVNGKGIGGRNQEIALAASLGLSTRPKIEQRAYCSLLSAGTDGQDGPCDAAGALALQ